MNTRLARSALIRAAVMRQNWHHLLFLHWRVSADALQSLLPDSLLLDTFNEVAYVGLVPFTMTGVRAMGMPSWRSLANFHEVNVRTYVKPRGGGEPGVWFFSLDAGSAAAVRMARTFYRLPYHMAQMSMETTRLNPGRPDRGEIGEIHYASERSWPGPVPAHCRVAYQPRGPCRTAAVGSLEHFFVERYLLYTTFASRLIKCRVYHTHYPIQNASVRGLDETLIAAAGIQHPDAEPLALYSRGVRVRIGAPQFFHEQRYR